MGFMGILYVLAYSDMLLGAYSSTRPMTEQELAGLVGPLFFPARVSPRCRAHAWRASQSKWGLRGMRMTHRPSFLLRVQSRTKLRIGGSLRCTDPRMWVPQL